MRRILGRRLAWAALLVLAPAGDAAVLGLEGADARIEQGILSAPVVLKPGAGEAVASLQFDVYYDTKALRFAGVETGARAVQAEKTAHANELRSGQLRVVLAGFNGNLIEPGDVVWLRFTRDGGLGQSTSLRLEEAILSDPFGSPVPVDASPDTLVVGQDANTVFAADSGTDTAPAGRAEGLFRYRAVLFALVVVGLTMALAKNAPKKGRSR